MCLRVVIILWFYTESSTEYPMNLHSIFTVGIRPDLFGGQPLFFLFDFYMCLYFKFIIIFVFFIHVFVLTSRFIQKRRYLLDCWILLVLILYWICFVLFWNDKGYYQYMVCWVQSQLDYRLRGHPINMILWKRTVKILTVAQNKLEISRSCSPLRKITDLVICAHSGHHRRDVRV